MTLMEPSSPIMFIWFIIKRCLWSLYARINILYSEKVWLGESLAGRKFGELSLSEHLVKESLVN